MKWTKTTMAWSLAAFLFAAATGGILRAQQDSAGGQTAPPDATATPKAELGPDGFGDFFEPFAPNSNRGPAPVAKPPGGVGLKQGQTAYSPGMPPPFGAAEADDPETAELRQADGALARKSEDLVAQYAATEDDEQRGGAKTLLAELLAQQFSVQQQLRERELARVEARVKKLRELTQKRREAQRTIVEQRLDQLLREADGLGWTPPGAAPQGDAGANNSPSQQPAFQRFFNKTPTGVQQNLAPAAAPAPTIGVPPRR